MTEHPERIGPYRVLRTLGVGGMGIVYEAEQLEPVRRRVALKIIRGGMDLKQFIARFDAERQALAVMNHPNIAKVLDGGTFAGVPFYVMELVSGTSLNDFCDEHRLNTEQRLRLFLDVCSAVHHAHQKGVIHRDLKPSNVLVTFENDRPVAKVIDFGIAKALGQRLTDLTLVTRSGEPVGTPAYMSPEQWDVDTHDIDTRTDIYSLGVMLYEILAGQLPFPTEQLLRAGSAAPILLRDTPPPTPSTLVESLGARRITLAHARRTDPRAWARELRGDLDWITLKAMAPDRRRRYETARELAMDIERHLRNEPVAASPPGSLYRLGRFLARHRVAVAATASVVVAVLAFGVYASVQARRIARERDRVQAEAEKVRALNAFLENTLLAPDPLEGIGKDATVLEALDSAVVRLSRDRPSSATVEASVRSAIGWAYFRLALYEKAEPLMLSALVIRDSLRPPDSLGLAESLVRVAQLRHKQGRYDAAGPLFDRALTLLGVLGSWRERAPSRELASAQVVSAAFRRDAEDTTVALTLLRSAQRIFERLGDSLGMSSVDDQLGVLEYSRSNLPEAERLMRRSLDYKQRRFGRHPFVAGQLSNLGVLLEDLNRPQEAESVYREALAIGTPMLGETHDVVTATTNNLGVLLSNAGKHDEAVALLRRALAVDEQKLGRENPAVAIDLLNLSHAICRRRGTPEAITLASRAARIFAASDPDSWSVGQARLQLGRCHLALGQLDAAERELKVAMNLLERALGPAHRRVDSARVYLGEVERARRR